jgi:hypothetical protein
VRVRKLSLSEPRTTPSRPYLASSKDPRDDQLEISSLEQVYWATVGERELVEEVLYYIFQEAIEVYSAYITYVKTGYWYCWWMDRNARLRHARQGGVHVFGKGVTLFPTQNVYPCSILRAARNSHEVARFKTHG